MIANSESINDYSEGLMILLFSMKKGSLKETEKLAVRQVESAGYQSRFQWFRWAQLPKSKCAPFLLETLYCCGMHSFCTWESFLCICVPNCDTLKIKKCFKYLKFGMMLMILSFVTSSTEHWQWYRSMGKNKENDYGDITHTLFFSAASDRHSYMWTVHFQALDALLLEVQFS